MTSIVVAARAVSLGIGVNAALAAVKIVVGILGNSYALVADGIESTGDIVGSLVVWGGLRIASRPADESHPYGHGKAESIAGVLAAVGLLVAAGLIAVQSMHEIRHPHHPPAWYTLPVLVGTIVIKIAMARRMSGVGRHLSSTSLKVDAWHHLSDALTSGAVLVGITIALYAGPGYEAADDWGALAACVVIVINGVLIFRRGLHDVLDGSVSRDLQQDLDSVAAATPGVESTEKCRIRKSGVDLFVDIHVRVDPQMTVVEGHRVSHVVKARLLEQNARIKDVLVHIEPQA